MVKKHFSGYPESLDHFGKNEDINKIILLTFWSLWKVWPYFDLSAARKIVRYS